MNRLSLLLKSNGFVNSIRMTSTFLGIPIYKVNAFYVDGLLIDTGFTFGRDRFLKLLDTLHPEIVVNTHHHEDHTGNNFLIREKYHLLPLAHPKTSFYLRDPSHWLPWYRRLVWGCPPPSETGELNSKVQTKKFLFLVIPTPGHSDDHVCFFEPNEGWLFSGDLFLSEQMKYLREEENIFSIIDSLKKVVALHPKKMFCSFNGLIEHPMEALHKKIDYLENLQKGVEEGFRRGLSPREIQRRLLGRVDRLGFFTFGEISKRNLIYAFLKLKGVKR
ncbi:MAG: MBL fold metallo-hydrolase [Syntrophaceae bacterium]|nr:MBL fold metallo-hydrolase [Syntrophaceae bacterium]